MIKIKKQFSIALLTAVVGTSILFTGCQDKLTTEETNSISKKEITEKTVKITDMNGRDIEIPSPSELKKVYFPSPLAQLMVYTISPERMAGVVSELNEEQLKFMSKAKDLDVIGNFDGGKDMNFEEVLSTGAQVLISMGPMPLNEKSKESADNIQSQLGIPVIVVDGQFENRAEAYRFLGKVFGEEELCEKLAKYCEETFEDVKKKVATIPEGEKVSLYYAEGKDGLSTEPETSSHAAVFKYVGAKNVADVDLTPGSGMTPVSIEQILSWNPDVIFMGKGGQSPYKEITTSESWSHLKAVKNAMVYEAPNLPFSWIDRPPSSQQYLGLKYVGNILYPEVFDYDMPSEIQKFFKLFYKVDISLDEANEMMGLK